MESVYPVSMEKLDQGYGYILYESQLKDEGPLETLRLWGANDRANIFVDEIPTVTLYDRELLDEIKWEENKPEGQKLSILMENMGRVNFGPNLERQRKGIDEAYRLMVIITIIGKNIRFRWNIWNILILQFHPFLVHRIL